jgi:2-polyprenyl-6-methoxyphenol hydroxylase-like FAD-dependent oxidoreductase
VVARVRAWCSIFGSREVATTQLGDIEATDTRFPFILFVSQAEPERLLVDHFAGSGVSIERASELAEFDTDEGGLACLLRGREGRDVRVRVTWSGATGHTAPVRKGAGFSFEGGRYSQDFALGDVEADGPLEPDAINSFVGGGGVAMFFPLGTPRTWRVIAMRADAGTETAREQPDESAVGTLTLQELQTIVAPPTDGSVVVRDPVWLTHFKLHHRQIEHYRRVCVFLAGDAAPIHSRSARRG